MASESKGAEAQASIIANAHAAAMERLRVPLWYWLAAGVGIGYAVFAFGTFVPTLSFIAIVVVTLGARLLEFLLVRASGVRFRQIVGEAASWLKIAFVVGIVIAFCLAIALDGAVGDWWPGLILAGLVFFATLAFGQGYNWVLRHPADS